MSLTTMNPETRRLIQVTPAGRGGRRRGDVRPASGRQPARAEGFYRPERTCLLAIWPTYPEVGKGRTLPPKKTKVPAQPGRSRMQTGALKARARWWNSRSPDMLEENYMPYAMSVILSRATPGDRRFKTFAPQAALYHVQDGTAHLDRPVKGPMWVGGGHAAQPTRRRRCV